MGNRQEIALNLNEVWGKLSGRWDETTAKAFHRQYISKMTEVVEGFEKDCFELSVEAADLLKKLQLMEHDIDNK